MAEAVCSLLDARELPIERLAAADVAREVNAAICELEERLVGRAVTDRRVGFVCECGCLGIVAESVLAYRAGGGAWLAGHEPPSAAAGTGS